LLEEVAKCSYVLEYEGEVYARKDRRTHEREYASNNEGCYILDAQTPEGWVCIDSTRHLFSPGRLLNHAPSTKATLTPFKPLLIRREWRVGFKATRDLHVGEELIWDYGCPPGGIDWLFRRPVKSQNVADTGASAFIITEVAGVTARGSSTANDEEGEDVEEEDLGDAENGCAEEAAERVSGEGGSAGDGAADADERDKCERTEGRRWDHPDMRAGSGSSAAQDLESLHMFRDVVSRRHSEVASDVPCNSAVPPSSSSTLPEDCFLGGL
jgi:hypothetical protein